MVESSGGSRAGVENEGRMLLMFVSEGRFRISRDSKEDEDEVDRFDRGRALRSNERPRFCSVSRRW